MYLLSVSNEQLSYGIKKYNVRDKCIVLLFARILNKLLVTTWSVTVICLCMRYKNTA